MGLEKDLRFSRYLFLGILPEHLIVLDGVQILVDPIIRHHTIDVVFKVRLVLHGHMQYVSDGLSYYLFRVNFVLFVPVSSRDD